MQSKFNSLAIVDNKPKTCSLKDFLENFLKFREDVVIKKTKYDLKKAEDRVHVLLGLSVSVENIDKVIKIIRSSKNPDEARKIVYGMPYKEWKDKNQKPATQEQLDQMNARKNK